MVEDDLSLPDGIVLKQCKHGVFTFFERDRYIGKALDFYGEYSENEASFLMGLLKPGAVVIEAGANIGSLTVPLARACSSQVTVFAYEPNRALFYMLCTNLALNGLCNVVAKQAAVGAKAGTVVFAELGTGKYAGNFGAFGVEESQQYTVLGAPMVRLDDEGIVPSLIKIDVEGMECDVINGARNILRKHRPLLYVENDRVEKARELVGSLIELGYECHWHLTPLFNADNWGKQVINLWPGVGSFNMICIPQEAGAVFSCPPITVETAIRPDVIMDGELGFSEGVIA